MKWSFPFRHNWYDSRNSSGAAVVRIQSRFITLSPPSCEFTFISAKILNLPISDSPPANLKIGAWKFFPNSSNIADYFAWECILHQDTLKVFAKIRIQSFLHQLVCSNCQNPDIHPACWCCLIWKLKCWISLNWIRILWNEKQALLKCSWWLVDRFK